MSLILRTQKGSALTNEELDSNFIFLNEEINTNRQDINALANETIPALTTNINNQLSGKQPLNSKLTAISNTSSIGGVFVNGDAVNVRTFVAGPSGNLTIINNNGVDGNPTFDVSPSVVTLNGTQTLTNKSISGAQNTITNISLTSAVTGTLPVAKGGTGATSVSAARTSLGVLADPIGTGFVVRQEADTTAVRAIGVSGTGLSISEPSGINGNPTITSNATASNTPNTIVSRDALGNFTANVVTATLQGNASTVTNGVYTNGSYANPSWITSLDGSKVTNIPNSSLQNTTITLNGVTVALGGSGDIINPVTIPNTDTNNKPNTIPLRDASGNFAAGTITANLVGNVSGNVAGNVSGNAGTVTNGVYTTGSYANPTWIASLAGSKVTNIPNSSLQNSSITINGQSVALGGSTSINVDNGVSQNIPNRTVARDVAGNFSANVIYANLVGNVNGTVAGSVTGNAGTVTNGVYTTGSYANPSWITSLAGSKVTGIPNSSLQNSSITINGQSVALGGSTNIAVDTGTSLNQPNTLISRDASGNFAAGRITAALTGDVVGNTTGTHIGLVYGDVTGNVTGNVTGTASGNVARTGDTMTGYLTLPASPVNPLHAATKQYVDNAASASNYMFTSGVAFVYSYTNIMYNLALNQNYFDVYPPAGKTMNNLVAFIPSIGGVFYAGIVDGNDETKCEYSTLGDRVRVWVGNSEQRAAANANWLAVWR